MDIVKRRRNNYQKQPWFRDSWNTSVIKYYILCLHIFEDEYKSEIKIRFWFNPILYYVKSLSKICVTSKVLIIVQKHWLKLILKSIPKSIPNFQKFENEKNCPEIMLLGWSSMWLLTVSIIVDDKNRKRALVLNHKEIINIGFKPLGNH